MATAASPAPYYKLNPGASCVLENTPRVTPLPRSQPKNSSNNNNGVGFAGDNSAGLRAENSGGRRSLKSPFSPRSEASWDNTSCSSDVTNLQRRSWFDDVTANSLERRQKKRKSQKSPLAHQNQQGRSQTLPRSLRSSPASHLGELPLSGRSTPFNTTGSCDSINLALNNALGQSDVTSTERPWSPFNRSGLGFSPTIAAAAGRLSSDEMSLNSRQSPFSPTSLSALREQEPSKKSRTTVTDSGKPRNSDDPSDLKLTRDLVEAMTELKDIAEVARIIDDVDDEEWLLMFIGELEVHLNDLIKIDVARQQNEPNEDEDPFEELELQRIERQEKSTLLSVALDLIRYLKERTTYALHRRSRFNLPDDNKMTDNDEKEDTSFDTLGRLKALAAEKPTHSTCMNKWQRRLSNLAGTLDKYLQRLESATSIYLQPLTNGIPDGDITSMFRGVSTPHDDLEESKSHTNSRHHGALQQASNRPVAKTRNSRKVDTDQGQGQVEDRSRSKFDSRATSPGKVSRTKSSSGDSGYDERHPVGRMASSGSDYDVSEDGAQKRPRVVVDMTRRKGDGVLIVAVSRKIPNGREDGDAKDGGNTGVEKKGRLTTDRSGNLRSISASRKNEPPKSVRELAERYDRSASPSPAKQDRGRTPKRQELKSASPSPRELSVSDHLHPPAAQHVSGICLLPRHRRGGSLDRATWKKERSTWSGKTKDDSSILVAAIVPDTQRHVSGFSRMCDYKRSLSVPGSGARQVAETGGAEKRQVSEFRMQINGSGKESAISRRDKEVSHSPGVDERNGANTKRNVHSAIYNDKDTNGMSKEEPVSDFASLFSVKRSPVVADDSQRKNNDTHRNRQVPDKDELITRTTSTDLYSFSSSTPQPKTRTKKDFGGSPSKDAGLASRSTSSLSSSGSFKRSCSTEAMEELFEAVLEQDIKSPNHCRNSTMFNGRGSPETDFKDWKMAQPRRDGEGNAKSAYDRSRNNGGVTRSDGVMTDGPSYRDSSRNYELSPRGLNDSGFGADSVTPRTSSSGYNRSQSHGGYGGTTGGPQGYNSLNADSRESMGSARDTSMNINDDSKRDSSLSKRDSSVRSASSIGGRGSRTSLNSPSTSRSSMNSCSSQCNIIANENVQRADQELAKLKKRSNLLQRGITEAREERDEKDRRIAVLESRLQRMKKSVEQGRTEHGSVQEELSHLRRLLNQERRDSQLQISELEIKLQTLESKISRENERIDDLNKKIDQLQTENLMLRKKCDDLLKDKSILEEKLHEATMTLMREKRHSRRLQQENLRLEEELTKANEALNEEMASKAKLSSQVNEIIRSSEEIVMEVSAEEQRSSSRMSEAEELDLIREENLKLAQENQDLRETLVKEQDITAATTDCFRQQVEFLSSEVSLQQEAVRTQKELYETEIGRLLKSNEGTVSTTSSDGDVTMERRTLFSQIEYEQTITRTLYVENERLRGERDELLERIVEYEKSSNSGETAEFGCQAEDTSYMRMRAFDFYATEAQRDARKLLDRGRQLQEEGLRQSMRTQRLQVEVMKKTP